MAKTALVPDGWVYKSNKFVRAGFDWTTQMHRFVLALVSQIDRSQTDFGVQRVYISDIERASGVDNPNLYSEGASIAKALLNQKIEIMVGEDDYEGYNLFSACRYASGKGFLEARFNPDMRNVLLGLKERYTKFQLKQVMQLSSPYSMRFYEIMAMYRNLKWVDIPVAEIRRMFRLEEKYTRWRDLRRYVIEKAQKDLRKKCDLYFTFTEIKQGRRVVALKFQIHEVERTTPRKKDRKANRREIRIQEATPDYVDHFEIWHRLLPADERKHFDEQVEARVNERFGEASHRLRVFHVDEVGRELWAQLVNA